MDDQENKKDAHKTEQNEGVGEHSDVDSQKTTRRKFLKKVGIVTFSATIVDATLSHIVLGCGGGGGCGSGTPDENCTDPGWINKSGIIIDETKNTFLIEIEKKYKKIAKKTAIFRFNIDGKKIILDGSKIRFRPEDRIKKVR